MVSRSRVWGAFHPPSEVPFVASTLRIASICAGIGGLDLGLGLAFPDAASVLYVERDSYAASVLLARMEDEDLEPAPVWCGDLAGIDWHAWRGRIDAIAAGFPCQPHSVAGARQGTADDRWIWDDIAHAIEASGVSLVFLENVRGLLSSSGGASFEAVLSSLACLGFDAEWGVLAASSVGASHRRERVFILGVKRGSPLADANHQRRQQLGGGSLLDGVGAPLGHDADRCGGEGALGHAQSLGLPLGADVPGDARQERQATLRASLFPPGPYDHDGWIDWLERHPTTEPAVRRNADGVAPRVDRLRTLGNAVGPLQAGVAFRVLAHRLGLDLS